MQKFQLGIQARKKYAKSLIVAHYNLINHKHLSILLQTEKKYDAERSFAQLLFSPGFTESKICSGWYIITEIPV